MSLRTSLVTLLGALLWTTSSLAQEVQIEEIKNGLVLSIQAQKTYRLLPGSEKLPELSVGCVLKGKKVGQELVFSPGGSLIPDHAEAGAKSGETLVVRINGTRHVTHWIPYGEGFGYAYAGHTEADREHFIQEMLSSPTVEFEFQPFLTGVKTTAVFDTTQLAAEIKKHAECNPQS